MLSALLACCNCASAVLCCGGQECGFVNCSWSCPWRAAQCTAEIPVVFCGLQRRTNFAEFIFYLRAQDVKIMEKVGNTKL